MDMSYFQTFEVSFLTQKRTNSDSQRYDSYAYIFVLIMNIRKIFGLCQRKFIIYTCCFLTEYIKETHKTLSRQDVIIAFSKFNHETPFMLNNGWSTQLQHLSSSHLTSNFKPDVTCGRAYEKPSLSSIFEASCKV